MSLTYEYRFIGALLLTLFFWVETVLSHNWWEYNELPGDRATALSVSLKNPYALKEFLKHESLGTEGFSPEQMLLFKKKFAISDSMLRCVCLELKEESSVSRDSFGKIDASRNGEAKRLYLTSLSWLGLCANDAVRQELLSIVMSSAGQDSDVLQVSLLASLRTQSAQGAKQLLCRFLLGDKRNTISKFELYSFAKISYQEAGTEKREAILAALIASARRENGKIEFVTIDRIVAPRSYVYRHSWERLSLLERYSQEPPSKSIGIDEKLSAALKQARRFWHRTEIPASDSALLSANFSKPYLSITNAPAAFQGDEFVPEFSRIAGFAFVGTLLFVVATGCVVIVRRRFRRKCQAEAKESGVSANAAGGKKE